MPFYFFTSIESKKQNNNYYSACFTFIFKIKEVGNIIFGLYQSKHLLRFCETSRKRSDKSYKSELFSYLVELSKQIMPSHREFLLSLMRNRMFCENV